MITLGVYNSAFAGDLKFVNADDSKHSDMCIAAAESKKALKRKAREFNYTEAQINQFSCNGMHITKFAQKYSMNAEMPKAEMPEASVIKVFSFDNSVGNVEADICIAAAHSNAKYKELKSSLNKPESFFKSIKCNDVPLQRFAKKYGNKGFRS